MKIKVWELNVSHTFFIFWHKISIRMKLLGNYKFVITDFYP